MKRNIKFYIVVALLVLVEVTSVFLMCKSLSDKPTLDNIKLKEIDNKDTFAIMLGDKNGVYTESESNTWPSNKSYTYNSERSGCIDKDGNKIDNALTFNSETNIATVSVSETAYCYLYFDIDSVVPVISSVTKTSDEQTSISISVSASDSKGIEKYYYSINESEYIESTNNTHTFNNLTAGTSYTIKVYVTDSVGNQSEVSTQTFSTKDASAGDDIIAQAPTGLETTARNGMYRFVGSSVNNYVSIGGVSYRIIGITSAANSTLGLEAGQLKVIKTDSIGTYNWHTDYSTDTKWESSAMYTYLNGTVLSNTSYIPSGWSDKIDSVKWYVGDVNTDSGLTGANVFGYEDNTTTSGNSKVGLMYLSDYFYAYTAGGGTDCYNNACTSWLTDTSNVTWTMTRYGYYSAYSGYYAWRVATVGSVGYTNLTYAGAVRPVFYLTSDVAFKSGTGTSSDPFVLE